MILYLTKDQIDALNDIKEGRLERMSVPGVWRAYKTECNSFVIEIFQDNIKCLLP